MTKRSRSVRMDNAERLEKCLAYLEDAHAWCRKRGVRLKVTNANQHWQFRAGTERADWWPSTARFVWNSSPDPGKSYTFHNWPDVRQMLADHCFPTGCETEKRDRNALVVGACVAAVYVAYRRLWWWQRPFAWACPNLSTAIRAMGTALREADVAAKKLEGE